MDEPKLYRCRICGDVYYGKHPSHCPYCGAHARYLVGINTWKEENLDQNIDDPGDQEALKISQGLELYNTRFYRAAAITNDAEVSGYFKYLARMENEHYGIFCKLLGNEKNPAINKPSESKGTDLANLEHSSEREAMAVAKYAEFAKSAKHPRLREVFEAVSEIESDHLNLDHLEINKLRG